MNALLLPVPEAAAALGLSRRGLYRLIETGDLETVKLGGRRLIPADALTELVQRLRQTA